MLDMCFDMNRLREIRETKGLTLHEVAKAIGTTLATIQRWEAGTRNVSLRWLEKLARCYEVQVGDLVAAQGEHTGTYKKSILSTQIKSDMSDFSFGPDLVPIVGYANATSSAIVLNYDAPIGETLRHPTQRGVKNAFLVKIVDDTMIPRYFPEEFGVVKGGMGPLPDGDCLIETTEGEGYIKKFLRRTPKEIICEQYNPPKQWKMPIAKVKSIHAISGRQSHI